MAIGQRNNHPIAGFSLQNRLFHSDPPVRISLIRHRLRLRHLPPGEGLALHDHGAQCVADQFFSGSVGIGAFEGGLNFCGAVTQLL